MRNFNSAPKPTQAPELGTGTWDYSGPISAGVPMNPGGSSEWMSTQAPEAPAWDTSSDWGDPVPTGNESWNTTTPPSLESTYSNQSESRIGERLRELRDKVVHGMGRRALDTVMGKLPSFKGKDMLQNTATNLYEDPMSRQNVMNGYSDVRNNLGGYREQAGQFAKSAGREVAGAGMTAAKEAAMNYYGLEKDENEKIRVARKLKFGKAVVKTLVNPVGTASSVGVRAGKAARKASGQEAASQFKNARQNFNVAPQPVAANYESW